MKVGATNIPGILRFRLDVHQDERGSFAEIYKRTSYRDIGIDVEFVQDMHSCSRQGVLRGLHYQVSRPQGHLVTAVSGRIFDVGVDLRSGSPSFGQCFDTVLDGDRFDQVYLPPGIAHGFCVLSETANVIYKCTEFYLPGDEGGLFWKDPDLGINWPTIEVHIATRDKEWPCLKAIPEHLLPRMQYKAGTQCPSYKGLS